jgi:hypothetical protein
MVPFPRPPAAEAAMTPTATIAAATAEAIINVRPLLISRNAQA